MSPRGQAPVRPLRTPRLAIRPLNAGDVPALHALWTTVGVRRFLWDNEVVPLERTQAIVEKSVALMATDGYGLWGGWLRAPLDSAETGVAWDKPLDSVDYGLARDKPLGAVDVGLAPGKPLVGIAGFWHFREPPDLQFLFAIEEEKWGQGFGVELGRAIIDHGFATLGMSEIRACTDTPNVASIRALTKLGFRQTKRAMIGDLDTIFFTLQRPMPRT
jgi:RimJ/RimL family protein N-acetyltransferase